MKILVAEDERGVRGLLERLLRSWGYEVVLAADGNEAWQALQGNGAPQLAIFDWIMPGMSGVEVCRGLRGAADATPPYIILVTAKRRSEEIVEGLEAGADDYIVKPFDNEELHARVRVGVRTTELRQELAGRVKALEDALGHVRRLHGLLPICAWCKKVRDERDYWQEVETYIAANSEAVFSHCLCPDCREKYVAPAIERMRQESGS